MVLDTQKATTTPRRLTCFRCGRLLCKAYEVVGEGVIEIQCWHGSCKALNAISLVMLDRYQGEGAGNASR